jgi:hypothetical protein
MRIDILDMANTEIFESIESIDKMNDVEYLPRGAT